MKLHGITCAERHEQHLIGWHFQVQKVCYSHEGTLNKFLIDDKGMHESQMINVLAQARSFKRNMWVFPKIRVPQNGWFIMENPSKMYILGVPLFLETPIWRGLFKNSTQMTIDWIRTLNDDQLYSETLVVYPNFSGGTTIFLDKPSIYFPKHLENLKNVESLVRQALPDVAFGRGCSCWSLDCHLWCTQMIQHELFWPAWNW